MASSSPSSSSSPPPPRTPHSCDGYNDFISSGFGFEFSTRLEQAWQRKTGRDAGRLHRYAPFGMTHDDLRCPTPEHMRDSYERFIEAEMEDLRAPTLSPPPAVPSSPLIAAKGHSASSNNERKGIPKQKQKLRSSGVPNKGKREGGMRKGRKVRKGRVAKSTHAMETRSRLQERLEAAGSARLALPRG